VASAEPAICGQRGARTTAPGSVRGGRLARRLEADDDIAGFLPGLDVPRFHTIWRKGYERDRDAYAVTAQHPGFAAFLRGSGIRAVVICGIAANICCFFTARDLRYDGFEVVIVENASAGLDVPVWILGSSTFGAQLAAALGAVRSASVFFAGKDATLDGVAVRKGAPAAAIGKQLIAADSVGEVVLAAAEALGAADGGLVTLYYGGAQKERDAQRYAAEIGEQFADVNVEYYYGGQSGPGSWVWLER